ncbi:MAG: sulfite exporter TauE/SafE family protein [Bacteroidales bacterium]|nr:sulfite exporter TauE/SafE family protein [Bacteroidales bacterium]
MRVFLAISTPFKLIIINHSAGFLGHLSTGHFDPSLALPLAVGAALGGFIGTQLTVNIQPKKLKVIFAVTSLLAAVIMVVNA